MDSPQLEHTQIKENYKVNIKMSGTIQWQAQQISA